MAKCGRCIAEEEAGMACLTCPCSSTPSSNTSTANNPKEELTMEDLIVLDMMQLQNLCRNGNLQAGVEFCIRGEYTPLLAGDGQQSNSDRQASAQVPSNMSRYSPTLITFTDIVKSSFLSSFCDPHHNFQFWSSGQENYGCSC